MVRETRHLWVGNLPDNIREEDIVEHFKRYGRVQSVKVVSRGALDGMSGVPVGGACATVSFMDIKSASKAHNIEQKFEECALTTEYHEPAAIPREPPPNPASVPAPLIPLSPLTPSNPAHYGSPRYNHGSSTEEVPFDRSSHFYAEGESSYARRSSSYHSSSSSSDSNIRGRPRDRLYSRNGPPYPIESVVTRTPGASSTGGTLHSRGGWSYEGTGRYTPPDHPSLISPRRGDSAPIITTPTTTTTTTVSVSIHRKKHSKSRSGSNGSESGGSNSISSSRSRSRSNSSSSRSSSTSSPHSSPSSSKTCSTHRSRSTLQSAVSTSSPGLHSEDRRALAICVRNLPARSSDTSLKDGLYHEYKKHGKVSWVKIIGQGVDRYGLVCFKKADDAEKAVIQSHEKQFFGCKIEVAPYHDVDLDFEFSRNESCCRPYEAELDEFHPKATRTLFIGNLEKDITASELQKHFDQFGQIIFVDIKKQSSSSAFAFVQYTDISSVVRAMRAMDGEYVGNNRVNLGYGKSLATTCVWVDGIADNVSDKYLSVQFSQYGAVSHVEIDRSRGQALVFYQQGMMAQAAVNGMRGVMMRGRKLQVDFASRECQDAFYESQKSSSIFENSIGASPASSASGGGGPPIVRGGLDTPSSSSSSGGGSTSSSRNYRHSTSRPSPIYSRAPSPTPLSLTPKRLSSSSLIRCDYTNEYVMDRRPPYRSFEDAVIEEKMVVVIQQAPSEMRHQKERMSLDEISSMEEAQEHRRKCKHRRSHSGENSRPGTPLCDERPDYATNSKHDPTTPFPLFSNPLSSLSKPPPSPPPSTPSPPYVAPPRPPSSSSEDSEPSSSSFTQLTDWELRLKSLDEKYEEWSGNRNVTATNKMEKPVRHKLLEMNVHELQPSDIVKSVLAKRSIFDEDSKRLENMNEKYEPKEYIPSRIGLQNFRSYLTPAPSPCPVKPVPVNKGLQYPFPSHPHVVNNCQPQHLRREPVTVNHTLIEPISNTISKPTVPMPNNIRRNSTNSTLGDTARRRSRDETVQIPQLSETKNVNETIIKLECKPLSETSTNSTSSNKDLKAIPPGEDIKPDIKPSIEENSSVVDNKITTEVPPVETKPSVEIVPKSEPTPPTVAPVIKHELPTSTTSIEVKVTPSLIKCSEIVPAPVERRRSIEEPEQKEVEDKTIECNKTTKHVNLVLSTPSPLPCPSMTPKDCDVNETIVDNNKRDTERDRRKSKELIDHNSSSTSTVPTSIEITSIATKSRPIDCLDKVESKEKKEVKNNCVDTHSKHKDRRESEREKRKEKENVEIKSNSQRKEHENHKIQISDRRTSKEDNEEKDKKKNSEHSSSKQHKSRDTESEHSSSRHHNNIPRKEKYKSSSSRHEKKSHDHDRKDNHDENKRKDNYEEVKRKDSHDENRRKDSHDESKRKENHDEVKRRDSHDEIKRKDSHEETKKKDNLDDSKRKDHHEEIKRKESHDEIKRKDNHEELKRKDSHDETKRRENHVDEYKKKEAHDEVKRKDSHDETKRKDSHDDIKRKDTHEETKRKESHDEIKRKDSHDEIKRKDSHDEIKRKDSHDETKRRENHVDEYKKKDAHDEVKRKDSHDEIKRKDSHDEIKRKDSHDEIKQKYSHDEIKRKNGHDEIKKKDKESSDEIKRKDSHDDIKRKDSHEEIKRKDSHEECKKKDTHEEFKRKDSHEEVKRKDSPDESKRKDHHDDLKRKDNHEETKRRDDNDDSKRKESHEDNRRRENHDETKKNHDEIKRKDSIDETKRNHHEETKKKENLDDSKRKEHHEEVKRKDHHEEIKRKDSHDETKRRENHMDEYKRKESSDDKKKEEDNRKKDHEEVKRRDNEERKRDGEEHKRKEVVDEHKRKEHEDRQHREDKESHSYYQRHNSHNKDKEHREPSEKVREESSKHDHNGHKRKENSEESSRLKRKDSDHHHHDTSKRKDEDKRKETSDKDRRKERYSFDSSEAVVKKESEGGEKKKEFDMFKIERKRSYDNSDKTRKEDTPVTEKKENLCLIENISDAEESTEKRNHIKKEQRKERSSNNSWPATVGCKRRLSSQDSLDSTLDDIKRMKPERRDSKDSKDSSKSNTSTSSSTSSQKKHGDKDKHQKNVAKMLEEKIKEDREKESLSKPKIESKESDDNDSPKSRKDKKNFENKGSESETCENKKRNKVIRENGLTTCSESETGSCDDEGRNKKHSIFDIVDDTPAYISMYDKVKARSCKNMQKHEEVKKQEKMREKFSQLKQSRAKREEKKRSTSYDEDTDSERGIGRRNSKHMITSSEDDHTSDHYETKPMLKKPIISDTSDDDVLKVSKSKLKSKPRLLRSEDSELDTTQDSLLSFVKSELKQENIPATPVKEETREHKSGEKNNKRDSLNNQTNVDTDSETHSKKKSHRKKEKRQKSLDSSLSCNDTINVSGKKEKHKKERRKSHNHDSDASGKHVKSRKKKNSRNSSNCKKLEVKLETSLFEPLSDDSGNPVIKDKINNTSSKWQVGQVFSDSDSDNEITRIQDKKRRERKSRELDEAGKALEAKLMDETDHFDATNVLVEKVKKKKKKKKKHHNHHKQRNIEHEEGDGDDEDEEARSTENEPASTPPISNQCLSSLLESPPLSVAPCKKPDKPDIPGFGLPMDENVHDSAVKSISECENVKLPDPEPAPAPAEEKPTVVISQEETEDAVAALLGDAFGGEFDDYAMDDTNKAGSPENMSENDLQIDTDPEDTFDLDFSKPPRTPDYPSHFETNASKEKKVPGFVLPKTPDVKPLEIPKTPGNEFKSEASPQVNKTPEMKNENMQLDVPLKMPPLRPFESFKPGEKPAPVTTTALEPIVKTPKHINVPTSSVLHKTTEILSHSSWSDKPMANLNKPITSLEHSIHKTVNLMDQYINKSPKPNLDSIIKSKNQENIILKPNNNMIHPYERVATHEQIFTNKPVVLSEQYKNIQNPDIVKNCIVSSEHSHHKAIVSACKPPMSDIKSVITLNKTVAPPAMTDSHKPQIHDNLQVKSSNIETSVVQSPQVNMMTTEQTTTPKANFPMPIQNDLSHWIDEIGETILVEKTGKVENPTSNSFHNKPEEQGGLKSNHACPVTIKQEDLIAKEKLERLYSNIQPDKYQFGNKTLTITDHNYVVNPYESACIKPNQEASKPIVSDKPLPDVVQKPKLAHKPLLETCYKSHLDDKTPQDVKLDNLPQEEVNTPKLADKLPEPCHKPNVTNEILSEVANKPNLVNKPLQESYKPNSENKSLAEPLKQIALDKVSQSVGHLTSIVPEKTLSEPPSEVNESVPTAPSEPNLTEKSSKSVLKHNVAEKSPNEIVYKPNPPLVEELKPEPKIVKFVEELNQKLNQEKTAQNLRKALVEESRKQHLEMLDKKEEPAVPIIAPLTPKMEEKPTIFVSPGESSCEPKDVESAQTRKDLTDEIKDKSDEDSSGAGGRRSRRRKAANVNSTGPATRMGNIVTRRTRYSNSVTSPAPAPPIEPSLPEPVPVVEAKPTKPVVQTGEEPHKSSDDVYEFKDDSDEEETDKPRPLHSVKSPHEETDKPRPLHSVKSPHEESDKPRLILSIKSSPEEADKSRSLHSVVKTAPEETDKPRLIISIKSPHQTKPTPEVVKTPSEETDKPRPLHSVKSTPEEAEKPRPPDHEETDKTRPLVSVRSTHETKPTPEVVKPNTAGPAPSNLEAKRPAHEIKSSTTPDVKSSVEVEKPAGPVISPPTEVNDNIVGVTVAASSPVMSEARTPSPSPLSNNCSASTRKSRRLQEKDITRNTVDDTIDEVIRSACSVTSPPLPSTTSSNVRRTTRSTAVSTTSPLTHEITRKSPRRKQANASSTPGPTIVKDTSPVSSRSGKKDPSDELLSSESTPSAIETDTSINTFPSPSPSSPLPPSTPTPTPTPAVAMDTTPPPVSTVTVAAEVVSTAPCSVITNTSAVASVASTAPSTLNSSSITTSITTIAVTTTAMITTTIAAATTTTAATATTTTVATKSGEVDETSMLIDPVSGELIPVREAEEGQYIPVQANGTRVNQESDEPSEKRQKVMTVPSIRVSPPPPPTPTQPSSSPNKMETTPSLLKPFAPLTSFVQSVPLCVGTSTIVTLPHKIAVTKLPNHLSKPLNIHVSNTSSIMQTINQVVSPKPALLSPSLNPGLTSIPQPIVTQANTIPSSLQQTPNMPRFTVPLQQQPMPQAMLGKLTTVMTPQPVVNKLNVTPQPQPLVTKFTMTSTPQPLIGKVIAVSSSLQAQPTLSIFTTVSSPSQAQTKFTNASSPQQAQTTITKFNTVTVPFQSSQPQPALAKFVTASSPIIHQPTPAKITSVPSPSLPQPNFTKYATITSVMPHHSVPKLPQVPSQQVSLAKLTTVPMTVQPQPSMTKFTTVPQPTIAKIPIVTTSQPQPQMQTQPQPQPINPKALLLNRTKTQAPLTPKAIILQSIANGPTLEAPVPLKPGGTPSPNLNTAAPRSIPMEIDTPRPIPYEASSMNEVIPGYQHPTPGYVHPSVSMYHQSMYHHLREAALAQQQGGYHTSGSSQDKEAADVVPPGVGSSPHERTTDSPQVATLYTLGNRLLFHQPPPGFRPARHLTTPPHASPEPPLSTDTLYSVLERRYPVMWQGELVLKSDQAFVQMHYVFGNHLLARDALPLATAEGGLSPTPTLRIAQRMRLEQTQIDGVVRKMQTDGEHCMLLALPCGRTEVDVVQQSAYLQSGFITYLQQKQAAGIVNIAAPGTQQAAYIVHVFPSCEFANNSLAQIDAQLLKKVSELTYLVIIIATTATSVTG